MKQIFVLFWLLESRVNIYPTAKYTIKFFDNFSFSISTVFYNYFNLLFT